MLEECVVHHGDGLKLGRSVVVIPSLSSCLMLLEAVFSLVQSYGVPVYSLPVSLARTGLHPLKKKRTPRRSACGGV